MYLPSVVGEAGDSWHQSRATASPAQPVDVSWWCGSSQGGAAHFFLSLFLWWCLWPCLCLWPPVGALPEPGAEVGS